MLTQSINVVETARLRILDFFLMFPAEIRRIRLPSKLMATRKIAAALANPYHGPVSMYQVFREMEHIQLAAFRSLAASGVFDASDFEQGMIRRTEAQLPNELQLGLDESRLRNAEAFELVALKLSQIPLAGIDGLKHRSGLMEHRYDVNA
jgi:hypothetical protein